MEVTSREGSFSGIGAQVRQWFVKNHRDALHAAALLIRFEGCVAKPYQDSAGVWTVGVGHVLTADQADGALQGEGAPGSNGEWTVEGIAAALQCDLLAAEARIPVDVWKASTVKQRQALLCLTFNVGEIGGSFLHQNLEAHASNGSMVGVVREWVTYDHAAQVEVRGLLRRRLAECALWVDGA